MSVLIMERRLARTFATARVGLNVRVEISSLSVDVSNGDLGSKSHI